MAQPDLTHQNQQFAIELQFAEQVAAEAAHLALSQFGSAIARRKVDGTLVTATDEALDRLISAHIAEAFPGDAILSEEHITFYDPAISRCWVIDPLDGTTNFARGFPTWGVSIALLVDGDPVVGVVNFPALEEIFTATKGGGAMRNGVPIHTLSTAITDANDQIFSECTRTRRLFSVTLPFKYRSLGSAAYHLCKVAQGCAIGGIEGTPKVWDISAAALIVTEAGGILHPLAVGTEHIFPLQNLAIEYGALAMPLLHAANAGVVASALPFIQPRAATRTTPTAVVIP